MRKSNLELLRFICCIMVVFFHQQVHRVKTANLLYALFSPFCQTPVPIFMIITGYMSINSHKNRTASFLITIFYYYLLNLLIGWLIFSNYENTTITWILFGGRDWWYFMSLIPIYFISPAINVMMKNISKIYSLLIIVFLYLTFFLFSNIEYHFPFGIGNVIYLLAIYMMGGFLKLYLDDKAYQKILLNLAIIYLALLFIIYLTLFFTLQWIENGTNSSQLILAAISIFIIFKNMPLKDRKFTNFLGSLSLPIYLFHALFEEITNNSILIHFTITNNDLLLFANFIFTFIMVFFVSIIIIVPINYLISQTNKIFKKFYYWISNSLNKKRIKQL